LACRLDGGGNAALDGFGIGHIEAVMNEGLSAGCMDFVTHRLKGRRTPAGKAHGMAASGERQRDRLSDAASGARDEGVAPAHHLPAVVAARARLFTYCARAER